MKVIVFLADAETGPSSRFRILQYRRRFAAAGIELTVAAPAPEFLFRKFTSTRSFFVKLVYYLVYALRRLRDVLRADLFDVAIIQSDLFPYGPPLFERVLRQRNPAVLYDTDDANFFRPALIRPSVFQRFRRLEKYLEVMRLARRVTVANEFIAEHAREQNPNVRIIPMALDLDEYSPPVRVRARDGSRPGDPVVIGWTGTRTSVGYLAQVVAPLERLAERWSIVLHVVTGSPLLPPMGNVPIRRIAWTALAELPSLRAFDIGIVPLAEGAFELGKFPIKLLQFMALGLPVVASAFGTSSVVVEHGYNGLLARTPEQWSEALELLVASPQRRRQIGEAARAEVAAKHSVEAVAPMFIEEIRRTLANGRHTGPQDPRSTI